jgi:SAM-dependent methyltransferase
MSSAPKGPSSTDYGVDAPGVIRNFIVLGSALVTVSHFLPRFLGSFGTVTGAVFLFEGLAMFLYAKSGKFRHRDRMLGMISWSGGEQVLDVGTGRGLLMIGAAKRLLSGKAIGIDIWNASDLSGNSMDNTLRNVESEGVKARIELRTEDARHLSFQDGTFDVVLSNLALHNIATAFDRAKACREIARVLKPGGTALISDFQKTGEYAAAFEAAGLVVSRQGPFLLDTFPPLWVVKATKAKF